MGKGSRRRPTLVTCEEEEIRWALALSQITRREFNRRLRLIRSKNLEVCK